MKFYLLPIAAIFMLTACAQTTTPPQTLSEKLEGKTLEEKQEELRLACLNEAEYTTKIKKANYRRHYGSKRLNTVQDTDETRRLKTLCREMTENYAQK
jgi:hypothetical protein